MSETANMPAGANSDLIFLEDHHEYRRLIEKTAWEDAYQQHYLCLFLRLNEDRLAKMKPLDAVQVIWDRMNEHELPVDYKMVAEWIMDERLEGRL